MLREKSIVTIAILLMGMLLFGQTTESPMPDDGWHRQGVDTQGCPTCHQMGPVMQRG